MKDDKQRRIVAYLDGLQAKVNELRELQSASGEELRPFVGRTLMPSVLDRAFKSYKMANEEQLSILKQVSKVEDR